MPNRVIAEKDGVRWDGELIVESVALAVDGLPGIEIPDFTFVAMGWAEMGEKGDDLWHFSNIDEIV